MMYDAAPPELPANGASRDHYEQRGDGLRELHECFEQATTRAECEVIADEADRRRCRPGLQPTIEMGYRVLSGLARKRIVAIALPTSDAIERSEMQRG